MVLVVVGEQHDVDVREVVEIHTRVDSADAGYAGPEVDVITGVQEVWLRRSVGGNGS